MNAGSFFLGNFEESCGGRFQIATRNLNDVLLVIASSKGTVLVLIFPLI